MPLTFQLWYNQRHITLQPGESGESPELYAHFLRTEAKGGYILEAILEPKQPLILKGAQINLKADYANSARIFCNGFQSWSESREYSPEESLPNLRSIARPLMGYYGDYHFDFIRRGRGYLHSWTYTYLRRPDGSLHFIGSLGEQAGFTFFQHHICEGRLSVERECRELHIDTPYPVLRLWCCEAINDATAFDNWFSLMDIAPPQAAPATGWTSWYNYYTNISETIILENLEAFTERQVPIKIFQIDDGYQQRVGDWLEIGNRKVEGEIFKGHSGAVPPNSKFPNGMAAIAQRIRAAGLTPGLWLAPFVAERKSRLAREHPEWLLRDERGSAVRAGWNPLWSGWFYALDIYHPGFRTYLENIFRTVLHEWGFGLLKLDFLYAACILPRKDKSRGQVMHEAMEWLRRMANGRQLLGCGVPLGSAFGQVDYCRIGADIHLYWEHRLLKWLRHRERVSTLLSLRSTFGRWQLSGRAFRNDPDVFLLRDNNIHLSPTQKRTILLANALGGQLLFTSDNIRHYNKETLEEFENALQLLEERLEAAEQIQKDVYRIRLASGTAAVCNLSDQKVSVETNGNGVLLLPPFESRILPNEGTRHHTGSFNSK